MGLKGTATLKRFLYYFDATWVPDSVKSYQSRRAGGAPWVLELRNAALGNHFLALHIVWTPAVFIHQMCMDSCLSIDYMCWLFALQSSTYGDIIISYIPNSNRGILQQLVSSEQTPNSDVLYIPVVVSDLLLPIGVVLLLFPYGPWTSLLVGSLSPSTHNYTAPNHCPSLVSQKQWVGPRRKPAKNKRTRKVINPYSPFRNST